MYSGVLTLQGLVKLTTSWLVKTIKFDTFGSDTQNGFTNDKSIGTLPFLQKRTCTGTFDYIGKVHSKQCFTCMGFISRMDLLYEDHRFCLG